MARERPILFSAPMVRAILDGRKTQTRRVVKPQPEHGVARCWYSRTGWGQAHEMGGGNCTCVPVPTPYGVPGDLLWVRETWHYINHQNGPGGLEVCVGYPADGENLPNRPSHVVPDPERWADKVDAWPFKHRRWPAIHMPRWASRLTLRVTEVRVERLHEISDTDAVAEGLTWDHHCWGIWNPDGGLRCGGSEDPREAFRCLWINVNGNGSWDANPWVWVVSFERAEAAPSGVAAQVEGEGSREEPLK